MDFGLVQTVWGFEGLSANAEATILFKPQAELWVNREEQHPGHQDSRLLNGKYQLIVPFKNETELIMVLFRQCELVQVIVPELLRSTSLQRPKVALSQYEG